MKPEITEIIKILTSYRDEMEEKYIAISILSLKDRWPNLTCEEIKEIEAVAYAIYYMDSDVDENGLLNGINFPDCLDDIQSNDKKYIDESDETFNSKYLIQNSIQEIDQNKNIFQKVKNFIKRNN